MKARILDNDGDLVWGVIEVKDEDKRKAFDPRADKLHNKSDVARGNPISQQKLGPNDVQVSGI